MLAPQSGQLNWAMDGIEASMLEGMGGLDLLCIDDVDRAAGDRAWEAALFAVFEELRANVAPIPHR